MPATNFTPIQLYRSTTSGNQPLAANMSAGEIALNIADTDMSMWMENASGTVKRFFNNPAALKYPTADGTSGQVIVTDGSGNLSFATPAGGALTNNVRQAVTSSATTTLNLNSGNVIDLTMAANITTLSFTNVPASGTPILVQIVVKNASSGVAYTITWPNSVYWSGQYAATTVGTVQTAPTLASGANGVTVIALLTTDGGTKWRGWVEATIPGGVFTGLYSWGSNFTGGQLGQSQGPLASLSSPVQIGALTDWASAETGRYFTAAVKNDGTLWTWGFNNKGQLGQTNLTYRSSPVQVGALTNWASVSPGYQVCAAVKTDGTLWTWGYNLFGQLGQNNTIDRSSPVQIGALTNWASASVGNGWCAAVKTDGTLWTWGLGTYGQLGQNTAVTIDKSSPVQVGALTDWASVSTFTGWCVARKTDGTLWSWGNNGSGQLGQNDTTARSSPVQIGALTTWSSAVVGNNHCLAIKTDGTLWTWGGGGSGQLGQNNTTSLSSPVQIGALTTWASASAGFVFSTAIKTDNTLWSWGSNNTGQLGQNSTGYLSSPVQVGALTNWQSISAGLFFCISRAGTPINPA